MKKHLRVALLCSLTIITILTCPPASYTQQPDSSYQELSDKFFDLLAHGKSSDAVDSLFETNPAMQKLTDESEQLKTQFGSLGSLMGSYVSRTKLVETKVAGMFVYQHYFVAYQRQPISVRIEYYKPGSKWVCYGLQFGAKLTDKIRDLSDEKITADAR